MSQCFLKACLTPISHISVEQWASLKVIPSCCQIISLSSVVLYLQFIFLMHRVTLTLELSSPVVCFILVLKETQFGALNVVGFLFVLIE